jgi:hypothetical protein
MLSGVNKLCVCCNKNKKETILQKINKKFYNLCPDCVQDTKWTQKVLEIGTNWILEKMPEKYQRTSKFSVTACNQ